MHDPLKPLKDFSIGAAVGVGMGMVLGIFRWWAPIFLVLAYLAGKYHWFT